MKFLKTPNLYGTRKALFLNSGKDKVSQEKVVEHPEQPNVKKDQNPLIQEHTPVYKNASQTKTPLPS